MVDKERGRRGEAEGEGEGEGLVCSLPLSPTASMCCL